MAAHEGPRPGRVAVARVVTGGQSGVDRAALDVAIELGVPYGGFVPRAGWAEDLPRPPGLLARYPELTPTEEAEPAVRTRRNVAVADATLVLTARGVSSPGTEATLREAVERGRPLLVVEVGDPVAAGALSSFLAGVPAACALNVAGPRESGWPGAYRAARAYLEANAAVLFGVGAP